MGLFGRKKTEDKKMDASLETHRDASLPKVSKEPVVQSVFMQPVVTEKATATGTYLFKVSSSATKSEIRKAFQAKYGKKPRKVNVVNVMGKVKMRGRVVGKRSNWKKVVVYLAPGEQVDLFQ